MLYISNIVDENTIEVSDSRTSKATVVNTDKLRAEGTKVYGLTQSRVVAYRDVEDFLTRYALRQKLVNPNYEYIFEYKVHKIRVSNIDIYATNTIDIEIPDFVDTIEGEVFQDRLNIRSVYIPDSVVSLGRSCFRHCDSLESVRLPQSLTHLGDCVFSRCKSLKNITLPSTLTSLGEGCFSECTTLTDIVLPESITKLGDCCFQKCTALTNIVLPEGITKLGKHCFYKCESLESITLPKTLTTLGENCFGSCESLKRLCLPSTVTHAGTFCFSHCRSLEDINISDTSIYELRLGCFSMCSSLKSIELPDSLQAVGGGIFENCCSLEEVRIPSLLNILKHRTFSGCTNLRRLTIVRLNIPVEASPKTIGFALTSCDKLSTIRIEDVANNSISDIETFIRYFKEGVPSIEIIEIDKSVGLSLSTVVKELGIEIRLLEE